MSSCCRKSTNGFGFGFVAREAVSDSKTDSVCLLVFEKGVLSLLFSNTGLGARAGCSAGGIVRSGLGAGTMTVGL